MAEGHGQRLSPLDATFLEMESPIQHMHVGAVFVFDEPPKGAFDFHRFVQLVRSRLHLVPRYRQKLAFTPLNVAAPVWVDAPDFDLAYHVRHAALPAPGTLDQLNEYAARILSRQLDRDRPLWELYVVEGLQDGGFALIGKNHHAMIDGISGLDLATVLLNVDPAAGQDIPEPAPWVVDEAPTGYHLAASAVREYLAEPASLLATVARRARHPAGSVRRVAEVGQGLVSFARSTVSRPAPPTMLNRRPSSSRRLATASIDLEDVKAVKDTFGTTVNDVVLSMVGDALGRYLRMHDQATEGLRLRTMVPVSVRTADEQHSLGNRVTSVFVDIPVGEMDPVERLRACHGTMSGIKASHSALGADTLLELAHLAPPPLHAEGARRMLQARLYNVLVTNVPGPQVPIYCLGARLQAAYPFVPLTVTQTLGIGVMSLDGRMHFGFTADWGARPDVDVLGDLVAGALSDLLASAAAERSRHERAMRRPTS